MRICRRRFAAIPGRVGVPPAGSGVSPEHSSSSTREAATQDASRGGQDAHPTRVNGSIRASDYRFSQTALLERAMESFAPARSVSAAGVLLAHRAKNTDVFRPVSPDATVIREPAAAPAASIYQRICRTNAHAPVGGSRFLGQSGKIRRFFFTWNTGASEKSARYGPSHFKTNQNPRTRRKNTDTGEDVKTDDTISHKTACPFAKNFNNQRASTVHQQNKI